MTESADEGRAAPPSEAPRSRNADAVAGVVQRRALAPVYRAVIALALGGLAVLALPPFSLFPVLLPAFGGLFLLLEGAAPAAAALTGWSFGFGFFLVGTHWIAESFFVDPQRFGWMAVPAVGGLGGFLALFPAAAAWAFARIKVGGTAGVLLFAGLWAGTEWLRGHVLTGFPWNLIGYTWVDHSGPRQVAAAVGSYGLSLLTVVAAMLPAVAVFTVSVRDRRHALVVLGIVVGALWIGNLRLPSGDLEEPSGPVVRVVQGNIAQAQKWRPEERAAIVERYLELSAKPGDYDILLWPETAYPGFLEENTTMLARVGKLLPRGAHLLTGTPRRTVEDDGPAYWNAIVAVDGRGRVTARYAKHHLVPFGEYVPLKGMLPIERLTAGLGDFSAGLGPQTVAVGGTAVGFSICYEAIFPGAVVERENRPTWIFNATNDAWFGTSIGPYQHLASARMRAVEEGLPMVRAANTGVSAVIDGFGAVRASLPLEETGILDTRLPRSLPPTVYGRYGDLVLIPLFLAAVSAGWAVRRPARRWPHDPSGL